jgi:DNA-binding NarL/FixJ family response regulator
MTNAPAPRVHASRIKVLIVDDHAVLRQALRLLLENQAEVEVVGDAQNGGRRWTQSRSSIRTSS